MELLTVEQVAEFLQISKKTVYRFIRSGEMKACKVGTHQYRISENALADFLSGER